ncbi:MAG TPA: hypothetical protein VGR78_15335 [Verrucomicrobiae bacterium]|jgi:hypothetical protein|nr:hypothetical protein [Verrucomicrobiae bacterium]
MRDLWNELAKRVREADQPASQSELNEMPFGFDDAVLRKLQSSTRERFNPWESWVPLLRPALGLAFGAAMICLVLDYRAEEKLPNNLVSQTEVLFQSAMLNE